MFEKIVVIMIMAALLVWLYSRIRRQPEAFSWANMSRSATVMGVLALALLGFIVFLVLLLRG
jgi:hypothetical protein